MLIVSTVITVANVIVLVVIIERRLCEKRYYFFFALAASDLISSGSYVAFTIYRFYLIATGGYLKEVPPSACAVIVAPIAITATTLSGCFVLFAMIIDRFLATVCFRYYYNTGGLRAGPTLLLVVIITIAIVGPGVFHAVMRNDPILASCSAADLFGKEYFSKFLF